jgi:glutaredoxin
VGLHCACAFHTFSILAQRKEEEGEVIVYTTSFRGVKATFEECRYVLSVLYLLRVRVTQRDVYMHKSNYAELEARLGQEDTAVKVTVPQVYISGQHIGVCIYIIYIIGSSIFNIIYIKSILNTCTP